MFFCLFLQHYLRGGEAAAEGEEQDGDEETSHCVLGLRGVRRSATKSKKPLLGHVCLCFSVCLCVCLLARVCTSATGVVINSVCCVCAVQSRAERDTLITASPVLSVDRAYSLSDVLSRGADALLSLSSRCAGSPRVNLSGFSVVSSPSLTLTRFLQDWRRAQIVTFPGGLYVNTHDMM